MNKSFADFFNDQVTFQKEVNEKFGYNAKVENIYCLWYNERAWINMPFIYIPLMKEDFEHGWKIKENTYRFTTRWRR